MPRDREKVRLHLQAAALELYRADGYAQTTAADIANRAGVTERTFFRHFPDKREVLFDGEAVLAVILEKAVREAPPAYGPWAVLLCAFQATEAYFDENRVMIGVRREIIAGSQSLQERELAKIKALTMTLESALTARGVPREIAFFAARISVVGFEQAFAVWMDTTSVRLSAQLSIAFADAHSLTAPQT